MELNLLIFSFLIVSVLCLARKPFAFLDHKIILLHFILKVVVFIFRVELESI